MLWKKWIGFGVLILGTANSGAQRTYKPNSVLASGTWYKISVQEAGIYKIDVPFLNSLGINTAGLAANSLRLFGNGGQMLPEANNIQPTDDLEENPLLVADGGDGILNGSDYVLFYARSSQEWIKDSVNHRFSHRKNLYSDKSFYFLTVGGTGKRITTASAGVNPAITITSFNDRIFHELDTINFAGSGKEWFGEEFGDAPGKTISRTFTISIPNLQLTQPITIISDCVARSIGVASRFDISLNNQLIQQLSIASLTGGQYDLAAQQARQNAVVTTTQNVLALNYKYIPGSFNSQGWLNWFEVFSRRELSFSGADQLLFRDWNSVGNNTGEFIISNASPATQVWDVTNPLVPVIMAGNIQGTSFHFINNCSRLHEYAAFNNINFLLPAAIGKVANQDLHNYRPADYLIVVHPSLLPQALRLAQFHQQKNNLRTVVVTTDQVFNEFASGSPDVTAIRDLVKMYYDKTAANPADRPAYLLLFGDASFDYKDRLKNNTNLVPAYESNSSLDPLSTYTSDDFFGFLDDNEDINSGLIINQLDIGIGRIPAKTVDEAKNYVDKAEAYYAKESFGPWRNNSTYIADDEDFNLHLQDAESITATAALTNPLFNQQKIYLDAFRQESGSGGSRYPDANIAVNNQVYNGTLIWNYNGHGGPSRLAEEVILDQQIVNTWNNAGRLPLFITATCDFAPYDNPVINSLGEDLLLRAKTGGIALMTTTRVVFAFSNRIINDNYLRFALAPDNNGKYKSLGEAVKTTKNYTYQTSGDIINNRKFTLLGDPALTLAFPELRVRTTKVNGIPVGMPDTLTATSTVTIEGEITDVAGNLLNDFNGTVSPSVFDKIQTVNTLANDPTSQVTGFRQQANILYRGKASVTQGKFSFTFKVPKDINYQVGNGRLSLYAENGSKDANGLFTDFFVGGAGNNPGTDNTGPDIKAYLNDERFVNGGISNENALLIVKLIDSSGINTAGTGIGHDITATLDNDTRQYFTLNDFYESDLDSYQKGTVRFQLPSLEPGLHTLRIKAWDVLNNSNEYTLEFSIEKDEELIIKHVLNYPNPFTTKTRFWFEHNKPAQDLKVNLQIFTLTGRVIKTIKTTINTPGNRSSELEWNGTDEFGDKIGRGVYLYKLTVTDLHNKKAEMIEKLVIL